MKIGRVIGKVWAERMALQLRGCRLYIVQPVKNNEEEHGSTLVVADPLNLAAPGDRVVYVTSTDATQAFPDGFAPVNASIVGLVDSIE